MNLWNYILGWFGKPEGATESQVIINLATAPTSSGRVPNLILPPRPSREMNAAKILVGLHLNSDEFWDYFRSKVKTLSGGNASNVELSVHNFRIWLSSTPSVSIVWGRYAFWSKALGGWNGSVVLQNSRKVMTAAERASHWSHEVTHAAGFSHNGNYQNSTTLASFPYQVGDRMQEYLSSKGIK